MDALDEIENKDQGKSFKAFWQFLMDEKKQQELTHLTDKLYALLKDREIEINNDRFLKNLKSYLHASGRKVIDSNKKLSEKISRVLSEKNLLERRRAMELIGEIRLLLLSEGQHCHSGLCQPILSAALLTISSLPGHRELKFPAISLFLHQTHLRFR